MMRWFLEHLVRFLGKPREIHDRDGVDPYLTRWFLLGRPAMPDGSDPYDEAGVPREGMYLTRKWFNVFLHRFNKSDDLDFHDHPWTWSFSIILAGGYREERLRDDGECSCMAGRFRVRTLKPWSVNVIRAADLHRVDLTGADCWSLFVAGPKTWSWGFVERMTGRRVPWRQYIDERRVAAKGA